MKKVNEKGERQNERKPKAAYAVLPSLEVTDSGPTSRRIPP